MVSAWYKAGAASSMLITPLSPELQGATREGRPISPSKSFSSNWLLKAVRPSSTKWVVSTAQGDGAVFLGPRTLLCCQTALPGPLQPYSQHRLTDGLGLGNVCVKALSGLPSAPPCIYSIQQDSVLPDEWQVSRLTVPGVMKNKPQTWSLTRAQGD